MSDWPPNQCAAAGRRGSPSLFQAFLSGAADLVKLRGGGLLRMANITERPDFEMCRDHLITDECSLSRAIATWQIEDLRGFSQTLENLIDAEDDRVAATYSGPPEDYRGWWLQDVVARQLRQSFVAACLDATAYHLNRVCEDVATILRRNSPDLRREAIKNARHFLDKAGFSDPSASHWDEMQDLYMFRNAVVHSMAMMLNGKQGKRFDRLLKRAPGITSRSGAFDLGPEFTSYVHRRVSDFFEVLHRELVKLCRRNAAQQYAAADEPLRGPPLNN